MLTKPGWLAGPHKPGKAAVLAAARSRPTDPRLGALYDDINQRHFGEPDARDQLFFEVCALADRWTSNSATPSLIPMPAFHSAIYVDSPVDLLCPIDREVKRIGVTRQAFIKLRLADTLTASR